MSSSKKNLLVIGSSVFLILFSLANVGMSAFLINKSDDFKNEGTVGDQSKVIKALFGLSLTLTLLMTLIVTFGQEAKSKFSKNKVVTCETISTAQKGIIFLSIGLIMTMTMLSYSIYNADDTIGKNKWTEEQVKNVKKNLGIFLAINLVLAIFMGAILYFQYKTASAQGVVDAIQKLDI